MAAAVVIKRQPLSIVAAETKTQAPTSIVAANTKARSRSRSPASAEKKTKPSDTWTYDKFNVFIALRDAHDKRPTADTKQACIEYIQKNYPYITPGDILLSWTTEEGDELLDDNILLIKPPPLKYDSNDPYTWRHNKYTVRQSLEPMCDRQFQLYCDVHGYSYSRFRLAPQQVSPTPAWPCGCWVCHKKR